MKKIVVSLFMGLLFLGANAQMFKKGDLAFSGGIGVGYAYSFYSGASGWPALFVSGEKGIVNISDFGVISAGGAIGYKKFTYSNYGLDGSWSDTYVGARAAFHFSKIKVDKLDLYAGVAVGLRFFTTPNYYFNSNGTYVENNTTSVDPYTGIFGGARYFFTNNFAAFGEVGYDITFLKLGVAFKL